MQERSLLTDAFLAVVSALEEESIPFAVMGGMAMQRWNRLRVTHDVDVAITTTAPGDELVAALRSHNLQPDPSRPPARLGELTVFFFEFRRAPGDYPVRVDLLLSDSEFHRKAIQRAVAEDFEGVPIPVATAEDLIVSKLIAMRPIDWADAVAIIREQAGRLDQQYLREWAVKLELESRLNQALAEAARSAG